MPYEFSFYGDAEDEAAKIGSFLTNGEDVYHYERLRLKNGNIFIYFTLGIFAELIAAAGAVLYGTTLYPARKK